MQYKLIGDNNVFSPLETVLRNRGIKDVEQYLNAANDHSVTNHYSKLKNIDEAVECLLLHIKNDSKIFVQVDSDLDGVTSSAMLINYLKNQYYNINIQWRLHEGKEHGIESKHVPNDIDLVIIPDAGSSNYTEHKKLYDRGINIIVLDHHLTEKESEHAIVVNNQISPEYKNKEFSGAGIVFKFLEVLDDKLNTNKANNYLDMVALGNIGDMMELHSLETRYYVTQGLNNLYNPFIKETFKEQEYSTKGNINPTSVSFYIAPLVNATIRSGSMEEKEQMFKAFLDDGLTKVYYERGKKYESLLTNTVRMMKRVRVRQNKLRDKGVELIEQRIQEKNLLDNKILTINVTGLLDSNLTGLVANQLVRKYQRPVLLLRYDEVNDILSGSARGYEDGIIKDFREYLLNTNQFIFVRGHDNAFGASISSSNLLKVNEYINEDLKDVEIGESVYEVDFDVPAKQLDKNLIIEIDEHKDMWGRGVEEPLLFIEEVEVEKRNVKILGKNKNTMKFAYKGIEYIKFFVENGEYEKLVEGDKTEILLINVIGRCSVNEFRGNRTPQIIIEDYEVVGVKERELVF